MNALLMSAVLSATALEVRVNTGAQLCVGETGWDDVEVCAAQIHVIRKRAERLGWSFVAMARRYSRALRSPLLRPWVVHLRDRTAKPRGWPTGPSWRRYRPRFATIRKVVRAVLLGEVRDECPRALHFGSVRLDGTPDRHVRSECFPEHRQGFYEPEGE